MDFEVGDTRIAMKNYINQLYTSTRVKKTRIPKNVVRIYKRNPITGRLNQVFKCHCCNKVYRSLSDLKAEHKILGAKDALRSQY